MCMNKIDYTESAEDLYINDFHRQNSVAAQREVARMLLHPYLREQVLEQVARFKSHSASKTKEND